MKSKLLQWNSINMHQCKLPVLKQAIVIMLPFAKLAKYDWGDTNRVVIFSVLNLWVIFLFQGNWDSWIRTSEYRSQSPVPYRLAIPQYFAINHFPWILWFLGLKSIIGRIKAINSNSRFKGSLHSIAWIKP